MIYIYIYIYERKEYEPARLELIYFDEKDVIATSGDNTDKTVGGSFWNDTGWT